VAMNPVVGHEVHCEAKQRGVAMSNTGDGGKARVGYDALLAGNAPAATVVLDDASILHIPGMSGLAGDYQGKEAILGLFARMAEVTDGTARFDSPRLVTHDDRVIVLRGRMTAGRIDSRLDTEVIHALSLRGDTIQEAWVFSLNEDAFDEFWCSR